MDYATQRRMAQQIQESRRRTYGQTSIKKKNVIDEDLQNEVVRGHGPRTVTRFPRTSDASTLDPTQKQHSGQAAGFPHGRGSGAPHPADLKLARKVKNDRMKPAPGDKDAVARHGHENSWANHIINRHRKHS